MSRAEPTTLHRDDTYHTHPHTTLTLTHTQHSHSLTHSHSHSPTHTHTLTHTHSHTHTHHSLCCMSSCCDTTGRLAELEQCTQERGGFNANQWLPCKEASHNVFLQQRELKLWSLHRLQEAWRDGHVPLWLGRSIIGRRLIAAADQLQKVIDIMEAAGREREF